MRYFSSFNGIGGFELGIERAYARLQSAERVAPDGSGGVPSSQAKPKPVPVCVGYSEIDPYAVRMYRRHYPSHKNYEDITQIKEAELPDFEFFCGGFPCQSFSVAGKRGGFNDTRGTLFFDICRILKEKQPRLVLLENVRGLLSHEEGRTFITIIATLDELGYDCQWQVLNSKNHRVPQNRERVFIVGHLRGTRRPEVFPLTGSDPQDYGGALEATYGKGGHNGTYPVEAGTLRTFKDGQGFRKVEGNVSPTLQARARNDGSGQPVIIQRPRGRNEGGVHEIAPTLSSNEWPRNNHLAYTLKARADSTIDKKHPQTLIATGVNRPSRGGEPRKDGMACAIKAGKSGSKNLMSEYDRLRRLTPVECERLQGFPDGWTEFDPEGKRMADTRRYFALGNAVTVNVIEEIMMRLL